MNPGIAGRRFALVLILVAVAAAGTAAAQYEEAAPNTLGLYVTEHPNAVCDICGTHESDRSGSPGLFTVYAVLLNPWNLDLDAPMAQVGGFAFRLVLPASVYLMDATFPSGTPCATGPDFVADGAALAVGNSACTLVTLSLGAFSGAEAYAYLAATGAGACRADALDVTDAAAPGVTYPVTPSSGQLLAPVFGFWANCGLPAGDEAWGAIKALYR